MRCRDVIAGEDAVKCRGEMYLPKLSGTDENEYRGYLMRAMFYGAADRTVRGLAGAVLRKAPNVKAPDSLKELLMRFSRDGDTLEQMSKCVIEEVLGVGRVGLLVDAPDSDGADPYVAIYFAENIINWRVEQVNGIRALTQVVLKESVEEPDPIDQFVTIEIEQYRVLVLRNINDKWEYQVELWRKRLKPVATKGDTHEVEWFVYETSTPTIAGGKSLEFIPFIFVNQTSITPDVQKGPLLDLVNVNLSHFRTSADLEHGRHFTALPTAWVAGFDSRKTRLAIGSSIAWVSDNPQAQAGFLEFTGAGLGSLQVAMSDKEKLMAVLGARLLEERSPMAEAAGTVKLRQSGEQSVLAHIAQSVSQALTTVLRWAILWKGDTGDASVELNQDFNLVGIDSQTLLALMNGVQNGMLSWDVMVYNLKRGELYPDNWSLDDERLAIEKGPPVSPVIGIPDSTTGPQSEPEPEPESEAKPVDA